MKYLVRVIASHIEDAMDEKTRLFDSSETAEAYAKTVYDEISGMDGWIGRGYFPSSGRKAAENGEHCATISQYIATIKGSTFITRAVITCAAPSAAAMRRELNINPESISE